MPDVSAVVRTTAFCDAGSLNLDPSHLRGDAGSLPSGGPVHLRQVPAGVFVPGFDPQRGTKFSRGLFWTARLGERNAEVVMRAGQAGIDGQCSSKT